MSRQNSKEVCDDDILHHDQILYQAVYAVAEGDG